MDGEKDMNSGNNASNLGVVKEDKGAQGVRKHYLDNIRWMTVILVVIYHVFYMYNAEGVIGGLGKISNLDVQYYDIYQYIVYP